MASAVLGVRMLLAVVFATAGVAKLLDRRGTREALEGFGVPGVALASGAILLPVAELATAVALVPQPSAQWGGLAALVLLLGFIAGISNALVRGEAPDCHCFGQLQSEPAGRGTLARNVVLAAMAAFVTVEGPGPSVTAWVGDRSAAELVAVAAGIAAVVLGALALRVWQSNRDLRRHLDNAHAELAVFPPGLPVGAPAPGFSLPNIDGETVTLDALRARGRPVLLVFVSPGCGPCETWSPELLRWQAMLANEITIAMISDGTPAQNRAIFGDGGAQVLLQEKSEVTKAYRVGGTPVTVLVSAEGMVASKPISGAIAGESFIRLTVRRAAAASGSGQIAPARPLT
jgi:methylamine dehydrogenase accessory protein MauD